MNFSRPNLSRAFAAALTFISPAVSPARAVLDLNGDSVPDVWSMAYETGVLPMAADTDGDGQTNADEAIAGTNPLKSDAAIKVTSVTNDVYGVHFRFRTQLGKRYQLQSKATLSSPTWTSQGSPINGIEGEMVMTENSVGAAEKFFRVAVQDMDTDGDGVTDWEEIQLGFNPNNSRSGGANSPDDLTAITAGLTAPVVVTVEATDSLAAEPAIGNPATETALFAIERTGGLGKVTVNLQWSGVASAITDYTHTGTSITLPLGVRSATALVTPLADPVGAPVVESPESVVLTLAANAAYQLGARTKAVAIISDYAAATGGGVLARFWNNTAATIPVFANTNVIPNTTAPRLTRIDASINNTWGALSPSSPGTEVAADYFVSRFTADVLPQFSQVYTFQAQLERGGRLWVNGQLLFSNWSNNPTAANLSATIELQAGHRYPMVFEHMARSGNATAILQWQSANQPLQVIPQNRLFPNTAPQILGNLEMLLVQGSPNIPYQIVASGEPTSYGAANLPPGWFINTSTGVITCVPSQAGKWDVALTASNAAGSGSAILNVNVIATGGGITRDLWTSISGTSVSDIPVNTNPNSTGTITVLETAENTGAPDDFGARIRGYITAPTTGVYKFWLTASDSAQLYISDDSEPVNAFKRAEVTAATGFRNWTNANAGRSPLLQLVAGQRYYVEVLHKAGSGSDHVSVGWLKPGEGGNDPGGATAATEVVPTYALSPYTPAGGGGQAVIYFAQLTPQAGAATSGSGSVAVQLTADETQGILRVNYGNLTSAYFGMHLHDDRIPNPPGGLSNVVCDLDQPGDAVLQQDGTFLWTIQPRGALSVADVVEGIKTGHNYFNVHSVTYPGGEIKGYIRLLEGSQTFTPPAAAPNWTDDHASRAAASRFLIQATYGPSPADLDAGNPNSVLNLGYNGWIDYQAGLAPTLLYPTVFANRNQTDPQNSTYVGSILFNAWWKNAVSAPDQLRQRIAFALSEIVVTSEDGPLDERADALSSYYDVLLTHAFGNFRDLLEAVTLHPAMGRYLDMLNNRKPNLAAGRIPNENYAREILQLFSIGLNRMHPDGSLVLNSKGEIIPTYDQDGVIGFAHVFTGWTYHYTDALNGQDPMSFRTSNTGTANWIQPMQQVPLEHFTGRKRLLNNVVLRGLPVLGGQPLDPNGGHGATQYNDPLYQQLAGLELDAAHDALFNHPNCGPFICRQLIQRLVTSTPSRAYLYRVVSAFNDNGSGVRGDMTAVIKAILLDYEARSSALLTQQGYGKQREPVSRVSAIARGLPAPASMAGTYSQVGSRITINTAPGNHLYPNTANVPLEFGEASSGDLGSPLDATYTISEVTPQSFTVRVRSFEGPVNFEQNGAATRFTVGGNGFFPGVNDSIHLEYLTGAPSVPINGIDVVDFRSSDEFNIYLGVPNAKRATYAQAAGATDLIVTTRTATDTNGTAVAHGYLAGASVYLTFPSGTGTSGLYTINTVTANNFTVTAADTTARSGAALVVDAASALPQVTGTANVTRVSAGSEFANRSGSVVVNYSDWNMDSTGTDLNQTPLRSPTVFNFFLPDYQFPGILANAGLITPEFELTSETSVLRQANFIYNGIFNDGLGQLGLASFKSGSRDVFVDLRPWMGAGPGGLPWAHNNNLGALIDELNTLLMGGQLPSSAKSIIQTYVQSLGYTKTITNTSVAANTVVSVSGHNFVNGQSVTITGVSGGSFSPSINGTFPATVLSTNTFSIPVARNNNTAATYTNARTSPHPDLLRDRVRAVVHLIVTSPDFTIQK